MNGDDRKRMIDRLLNEAQAPEEVEPRAGLEQRIIAHLRAQPAPQPWRTWRLAWLPVAVAAAVLLAILIKPMRFPQPVQPPVTLEHKEMSAPIEQPAAPHVVAKQGKAIRKPQALPTVAGVHARMSEPRQPVFAPARLSDAERALMAMLRSNPGEAKLALDRQEQSQQEAAEFMEQAFAQER